MNSSNHNLHFVITCSFGFGALVAEEAQKLGATVDETHVTKIANDKNQAVYCSGDLAFLYQYLLWGRLGSRLLMLIDEFDAADEAALYRGVKKIDWSGYFELNKTFSIRTSLVNVEWIKESFAPLKIKDAVVDKFQKQCHQRPNVSVKRPDFPIHVHIENQHVQVFLDCSGESLHQRGYRVGQGEAPLKENLAALMASMIPDPSKVDVILDPFCGSGTVLIESALLLLGCAPGVNRNYYGVFGWKGHLPKVFSAYQKQALSNNNQQFEKSTLKCVGYDANKDVVKIAQQNVQKAGLSKIIHIERRALHDLKTPKAEHVVVVTNPPYGERLGETDMAKYIYMALGKSLKSQLAGHQAVIIGPGTDELDGMALNYETQKRVFNGPLRCFIRNISSIQSANKEPVQTLLPLLSREGVEFEAESFANRIRKNFKKLKNWIKQEHISCYRIYDADIPEYNCAVDIYGDRIHVQEYAPPKSIDPALAKQRLDQALTVLVKLFDVPMSRIHVKTRQKQKGKQQYQKQNNRKQFYEVEEGGVPLLVNLNDYLDTGLFLDHRPMRLLFQNISQGKRYLNLFAYTGTASLHAAVGGAKETVSVDLSPTYCEWAKNNFALNGFSPDQHHVIQANCMEWLDNTHRQFDIIFMDPPTFSNSKRTRHVLDIQRDHVSLIHAAMGRLERGGVLYFSNNFRRFKLDEEALDKFSIKEITHQTIPPDFERHKDIHRCWQIEFK